MINRLKTCRLCPRSCGVNRLAGEKGYCQAGLHAAAALSALHLWEEPCLSGVNGAGTVFFSNCNLRCVYCQNHAISQQGGGREISTHRLAEIFLEQEARGAHNIDLVTPTHFAPQIIEALRLARSFGLTLPVVYNSNAYETEETVSFAASLVDVFLPDLKYFSEDWAVKYSSAPGYFPHASKAIEKMAELTGCPQLDSAGIMQKGVIVRHLILPGLMKDSFKILDWLWHTFGHSVYISIMNQFTPLYQSANHRELNRRLTTWEYNKVVDYALKLGFDNCFIQAGHTASERFVPNFNETGI